MLFTELIVDATEAIDLGSQVLALLFRQVQLLLEQDYLFVLHEDLLAEFFHLTICCFLDSAHRSLLSLLDKLLERIVFRFCLKVSNFSGLSLPAKTIGSNTLCHMLCYLLLLALDLVDDRLNVLDLAVTCTYLQTMFAVAVGCYL